MNSGEDGPGLHASIKPVELLSRASPAFALRVSFVLLEFAGSLLAARLLGLDQFGVYSYVMAWVGLLAVPAALGFDRLLVRRVAIEAARFHWAEVLRLARHATIMVLAISSALAIAFAGAGRVFAGSNPGLSSAMLAGAGLIPLLAYARVRQAVLQGLGHVPTGLLPESIVQPGVFAAACGLALIAAPDRLSGTVGVLLQVVAAATACGVGFMLLHTRMPRAPGDATAELREPFGIRNALPFIWMLAMNVSIMNMDTIAIGWMLGAEVTGPYRTASQMAAFIAFPLTAVNLVIAPRLAAMHGAGDWRQFQQVVHAGARISLVAGLGIFVVWLVAGKQVLQLFGPGFESGYPILMTLSCAYLVNSAVGVAGYVLIMTRFEREAALCFSAGAAVDVLLCLVLIPRMGAAGGAIATSAAIVTLGVGMLAMAKRRTGVNSFALAPSPRAG
ncbi:MAG: oligosaccharide flippase family protein [Steroidobacteraceae bacterium]